MRVSARLCQYEDIQPMWQTEEMQMDRKVSSMRYYDGQYFFGGNDMMVYDFSISKPKFMAAYTHDVVGPIGCISFHNVKAHLESPKGFDWHLPSTRVRGIYVVPEMRNWGVATTLLRMALFHASREPGFKWALVGPNSKKVHENLGFEQVTDHMHDLPDGNKSLHKNCYMRWAG